MGSGSHRSLAQAMRSCHQRSRPGCMLVSAALLSLAGWAVKQMLLRQGVRA